MPKPAAIAKRAARLGSAILRKPSRGGLPVLQRLLNLRTDDLIETDAIIVSFDMEFNRRPDRGPEYNGLPRPYVNQFALASFDTRHLRTLSSTTDLNRLISAHLFQSESFSERPDRSSPVAPHTIGQIQVTAAVLDHLMFIDEVALAAGKHRYRNVVLVGHSIWEDVDSLRALGIDLRTFSIVRMILDTHEMARYLFPPFHPELEIPAGSNFTLAGVLAKFGHRPDGSEFHNAANDAVYTLHLLLLLAVKSCKKSMRNPRSSSVTFNHWNLAKLEECASRLAEGTQTTLRERWRQYATQGSDTKNSETEVSPGLENSMVTSSPEIPTTGFKGLPTLSNPFIPKDKDSPDPKSPATFGPSFWGQSIGGPQTKAPGDPDATSAGVEISPGLENSVTSSVPEDTTAGTNGLASLNNVPASEDQVSSGTKSQGHSYRLAVVKKRVGSKRRRTRVGVAHLGRKATQQKSELLTRPGATPIAYTLKGR